jgi:hypothetical protein
MVGRVLGVVLIVFAVLAAWTAYANVFSDDGPVRARAEALAREQAGCGDGCRIGRIDGSRGVIHERIVYTFADGRVVIVTCRRPYLAFGEHVCTIER